MNRNKMRGAIALAAVALLGACVSEVEETPDTTTNVTGASAAGEIAPGSMPATTPAADPAMRLEVDLGARKVYVYRNGAVTDTHSVAVGSQEWPTRTGSFSISQVVWNPEWIPPDEAWAKDEKRAAPGASDNPLGRVQLVYDPPRSIHGTNDPSSFGKAVSHGSIRMGNDAITELAREVMQAGGAPRDESWIADARRNRSTKQVVDLPNPVPIVIR